jgi:D-inositol-3-phosphate glycosyltransferase
VDEVLPLSVDTANFSPGDQRAARERLGLAPAGPLVLFAGAWCYRKGVDLVAKLAAQFEDRAEFVVTGSREHADTEFPSCLRYLDAVPPAEMPTVYRAADVFLFPSRAESFGFVTAEAMACGLPVLTTAVGFGEDTSAHPMLGQFVVDAPPRLDVLAERLSLLLHETELRHQLAAAGRAFVEERCSPAAFASHYRALLDRFLPATVPCRR